MSFHGNFIHDCRSFRWNVDEKERERRVDELEKISRNERGSKRATGLATVGLLNTPSPVFKVEITRKR